MMSDSRTKRLRVVFLIVIGVAILAVGLIAIPNILQPRFDSASVALDVRLSVRDQVRGGPVAGAAVHTDRAFEDGLTDTNGQCDVFPRFRATGVVGRSGQFHVREGTLRVFAPGFKPWERPLESLLGSRYDFFQKGTTFTYTVTLVR